MCGALAHDEIFAVAGVEHITLRHRWCLPIIDQFKEIAKITSSECPLWVISGHMRRKQRCPLYPKKNIL